MSVLKDKAVWWTGCNTSMSPISWADQQKHRHVHSVGPVGLLDYAKKIAKTENSEDRALMLSLLNDIERYESQRKEMIEVFDDFKRVLEVIDKDLDEAQAKAVGEKK